MDVSPATWTALSKLLDEALDLDPAARAAWADRLGTTQPEIAALLRKLLAAQASDDNLLEHLPRVEAPAVGLGPASSFSAGSNVGPYRLIREIGSGGTADVWLAERADGAFAREIALKLPRLTRLRRDLAARFAHERDILARLEHPHIARFYDAGVTEDGLPWLAMEYVDGQPINRWCDERRLGVFARVRLFAQVLDAVQFAHASLVIHRDLKPSNLLVTGDAQVRLLDFGIAKMLADGAFALETQLTQFAGRALTPDYASPEQIKGEPLTTATDVYSLGVVLYELLAGRRPYQLQLQSAAQLEQAIVTVDPPWPSSAVSTEGAQARGTTEKRLARALKGDLDTIVLKALTKESARRYATIAEFADDLRRHLAGQTVHAQPASWGYRTRKFVKRNRVAVGAATAISVALIAGTVVSLWQAQLAEEQAQRAEQQAKRAEDVKQFVLSFFGSGEIEQGATRQTTAVDLLKQARERLDAAPITDMATRVELLTTIGTGLYGLGEMEHSASALAQATSLASANLSDRDPITGKAQQLYGYTLYQRGEMQLAAQQFDAAEAHSRRIGDMVTLAGALRGKSLLHDAKGQFDIALDLASEAVRAAERQRPPVDKVTVIEAYLFSADLRTANLQKGALEPARRAYLLARELYGDRPTGLLLLTRSGYAAALANEGDPEAALAEMKAVLQQQTETFGADNFQVVPTLERLGTLEGRLGDPASAIAAYGKARRINLAQAADKTTISIAYETINLAALLATAHRYDQALAEYQKAEADFTALQGPDSEPVRWARSGTASMLVRLGRLDEADAIFSALIGQPFHEPDQEGKFKVRLGRLRSAQGRHDEALALLRAVPDYFGEITDERTRALALAVLGDALVAAGRAEESLTVSAEAQTILLKEQRNGSPDLADIAVTMARAELELGRADQAVPLTEAALAFWSRFDPKCRDTGLSHLWQARALAAIGDGANAARSLGQASDILGTVGLRSDRALLKEAQREVRKTQLASGPEQTVPQLNER